MSNHWDAVVIGAGPAGSVAALEIARLGRRVLLVDRKPFPRRKVCGTCLSGTAASQLRELGLGSLLDDQNQCVPLSRYELRHGGRRLDLPTSGGYSIPRSELDAALADAAIEAGATFRDETSARVGDVSNGRRGVHLTSARTRERLTASVVVLAAGLTLKAPVEGMQVAVYRQSLLGAGAILPAESFDLPRGTLRMLAGREGYCGLVRTADGTVHAAAALDADLVKAEGIAGSVAKLVRHTHERTSDPFANVEWTGTPALTRTVRPVAAERLFLIGDAAGYVEPFTGEGIGWAIDAGRAIGPIVDEACRNWTNESATKWCRTYQRSIRSRQRLCRPLVRGLRNQRLTSCSLAAVSRWPVLARPLLSHLRLVESSPARASRS